MSYCRFSDRSFTCDVHCYDVEAGAVRIHVAHCRHVGPEPRPQLPLDWLDRGDEGMQDFLAAHQALMSWCAAATQEPIGLPHAGEQFTECDASAAAQQLERLRALGYRVPQYAIDALRAEGTNQENSNVTDHRT